MACSGARTSAGIVAGVDHQRIVVRILAGQRLHRRRGDGDAPGAGAPGIGRGERDQRRAAVIGDHRAGGRVDRGVEHVAQLVVAGVDQPGEIARVADVERGGDGRLVEHLAAVAGLAGGRAGQGQRAERAERQQQRRREGAGMRLCRVVHGGSPPAGMSGGRRSVGELPAPHHRQCTAGPRVSRARGAGAGAGAGAAASPDGPAGISASPDALRRLRALARRAPRPGGGVIGWNSA